MLNTFWWFSFFVSFLRLLLKVLSQHSTQKCRIIYVRIWLFSAVIFKTNFWWYPLDKGDLIESRDRGALVIGTEQPWHDVVALAVVEGQVLVAYLKGLPGLPWNQFHFPCQNLNIIYTDLICGQWCWCVLEWPRSLNVCTCMSSLCSQKCMPKILAISATYPFPNIAQF